jgi:IS30 family transposase
VDPSTDTPQVSQGPDWLPRGSNENLNRIVREYFPKGVEISSDPKYLAMVACDINDRPRKIHNWKKPSELFTELVESNASTG